jgi:hypothetical protein
MSMLRSDAMCLRTASPIGLRQMFPRQTTRTDATGAMLDDVNLIPKDIEFLLGLGTETIIQIDTIR